MPDAGLSALTGGLVQRKKIANCGYFGGGARLCNWYLGEIVQNAMHVSGLCMDGGGGGIPLSVDPAESIDKS